MGSFGGTFKCEKALVQIGRVSGGLFACRWSHYVLWRRLAGY
jgi:hypothetical protein